MVQVLMRTRAQNKMGSDGERQMKLRSPAAYFLLGGPVPNRPRLVLVHGPGVGDPCPKR